MSKKNIKKCRSKTFECNSCVAYFRFFDAIDSNRFHVITKGCPLKANMRPHWGHQGSGSKNGCDIFGDLGATCKRITKDEKFSGPARWSSCCDQVQPIYQNLSAKQRPRTWKNIHPVACTRSSHLCNLPTAAAWVSRLFLCRWGRSGPWLWWCWKDERLGFQLKQGIWEPDAKQNRGKKWMKMTFMRKWNKFFKMFQIFWNNLKISQNFQALFVSPPVVLLLLSIGCKHRQCRAWRHCLKLPGILASFPHCNGARPRSKLKHKANHPKSVWFISFTKLNAFVLP